MTRKRRRHRSRQWPTRHRRHRTVHENRKRHPRGVRDFDPVSELQDELMVLASVLDRVAVELDQEFEVAVSARNTALLAREAAGSKSVKLASRANRAAMALLDYSKARLMPRTSTSLELAIHGVSSVLARHPVSASTARTQSNNRKGTVRHYRIHGSPLPHDAITT